MSTSREIKANSGEFIKLCKEAGYSEYVWTETINLICCCDDKDKALAYMTDLAKKKVSEDDFYTEVVNLIYDEENNVARNKF